MPIYYQWRQSQFQSIFGSLGIGIDAVVNSQETKLLIIRLYKAHLETKRYMQAKAEEEDRKTRMRNAFWIERHLGESLRVFLRFGDRFPIVQWVRSLFK